MQRRTRSMENKMFCYQCQETANCTGCTITGVCGKNPQVAAAQDLLVYVTKGYCEVTTKLRKEGTNISDAENRMVVMNLFMTITNANFDKEAIENRIHDTLHCEKRIIKESKRYFWTYGSRFVGRKRRLGGNRQKSGSPFQPR